MATFTISGTEYKSRLFDGQMQMLITKRMVPVFTKLGSAIVDLLPFLSEANKLSLDNVEGIAFALQPVAEEIAKLKDEDVDFVMNACLGACERRLRVGNGWAPVVQNGVIQDPADSTFMARLSIMWQVLGENFGQVAGMVGLPAPVADG